MLDQKQIWAVFLLTFRMGGKAAKTTCNIIDTFSPGTDNKYTVQWWFKKFCKGDESLEDDEHSHWPLEVDNNQLKAIIKADRLTTTWEVARELNVDHSVVIQHWSKLKGWKSSISGCLMNWLKAKNNNPFEVSRLSLSVKLNFPEFTAQLTHEQAQSLSWSPPGGV